MKLFDYKYKCSYSATQIFLHFFPVSQKLSKMWLDFVVVSGLLALPITFSICKVGDCGLQTYQTEKILKRATTLEFATNSPILYIHC